MHCGTPCEQCIVPPVAAGSKLLIPDFHIASRSVLDRRKTSATWLARRNLSRIVRFEPAQPVRPPGASMLLGLRQPALDIGARRLGSGPILVFHLVRRVDDAGDVARSGQHEANLSAKKFAAQRYGFCRRNMIIACCKIVDGSFYALQIKLLAADDHLTLAEPVIKI